MTAKQIQNLRRSRNETCKEFGALLGVSDRTVQGWEQGRKISETAKRLLLLIAKRAA